MTKMKKLQRSKVLLIAGLTLLLLGFSSFMKQPDPDSGPTISCTGFFSCPRAKTVNGFPVPYYFYDSDGAQKQEIVHALVFDATVWFVVSFGFISVAWRIINSIIRSP
jgi:hypothetical protein